MRRYGGLTLDEIERTDGATYSAEGGFKALCRLGRCAVPLAARVRELEGLLTKTRREHMKACRCLICQRIDAALGASDEQV